MGRVTYLLILALVSSSSLAGPRYKAASWNISLEDGDRSSLNNAIRWVTSCDEGQCAEALRFELAPGNIGGSPTDHIARHGASFWERAELKSEILKDDRNFDVTFRVKFIEGFQGDRETFFQIHNHNNQCWPLPSLMLKWSTGGYLTTSTLKADQSSMRNRHFPIKISDLYNQWLDIKFTVRRLDSNRNMWTLFSPQLGRIEGRYFLPECRRVFLKFGIYRPGYKNITNIISKSELADIKLSYPFESVK